MRKTLVLLLTGLLFAAPLAAETVEVRAFSLKKDAEDVLLVEIREAGLLLVRVNVKRPLATAPVQLTLVGPDGVQVEKEGSAPLRLRYALEGSERLGTWRVVVKNHGKMALLTGKVRVDFEPSPPPPPAPPAAAPAVPSREVTDGKVFYPEDEARIRAVCRNKNQDVFVRLDMTSGKGGYYMGYNRVFELEVSYRSDEVIELRGGGEPFLLDTEKKVLYFASGEAGVFCRVRIYRGEPLG